MNNIECAGWINSSCDDGPGIRSVLFLQGCSKNCEGCHNNKIKNHGEGTLVDIDYIVSFIDKNCCNRKITISGGEPLEQLESLIVLLCKLKELGFEICVYTGWELNKVPDSVLSLVDYIKTGSFVNTLKKDTVQYVGSSNQHMFSLKHDSIVELDLAV